MITDEWLSVAVGVCLSGDDDESEQNFLSCFVDQIDTTVVMVNCGGVGLGLQRDGGWGFLIEATTGYCWDILLIDGAIGWQQMFVWWLLDSNKYLFGGVMEMQMVYGGGATMLELPMTIASSFVWVVMEQVVFRWW